MFKQQMQVKPLYPNWLLADIYNINDKPLPQHSKTLQVTAVWRPSIPQDNRSIYAVEPRQGVAAQTPVGEPLLAKV
jgi:hypothetical protein